MFVFLTEFVGVLIVLLVIGAIMHAFLIALGCALLIVAIVFLVKSILGAGP